MKRTALMSCHQIAVCVVVIFSTCACSMAQTPEPEGTADRGAAALSRSELTSYTPLTGKERLAYYFRHTYSVESVLRSAAGAGINQALNTPSEWGQGGEGYGRRFASSYGQHIVQATLMHAAAVPLHEDNRYFRSGEASFRARFKYAVARTFLARRDDGTTRLSYSRIGSYVAAAFISRAWQPPSTRGPEHAASAFSIEAGAEVGFNLGREFFPKIFHSEPPIGTNQYRAP
jgi:hypothetical protein